MNWIKKKLIPITLVVFSCLTGTLIIEVILQLTKNNDEWSVTREANILRNFQFQYRLNEDDNFEEKIQNYTRNQYGLRDDCAHNKDIKILTIGGSTTDQRYVQYKDTFQKIIQNILTAENPDFGCVTNAGMDGHSTWGHIFSFEKWFPLIPNLNPEYILLYIGFNDANFKRTNNPNLGYETTPNKGVKAFLIKFEIVNRLLPIYRYLNHSIQKDTISYTRHEKKKFKTDDYTITKLNKDTIVLSELNSKAFKSRLEVILRYIEDLETKLICVTQPHRYVINKNGTLYGLPNVMEDGFSGLDFDYSIREINKVILELCKENNLDLYNHNFSDEHFYDGVHTTAKGSIEIGKLMAKFIIDSDK